ncbi:SusC/RagA family TonB-linked outer membrane protein [Chitinophaga rhizosphaerae]|uniref:SusC/RagA family TonB-linked outer membrane protein n=1 Tax=Chitinophaga rhizosphaerae TaxID=1864947 RepID=UPI000F80C7E0|nr:SusC/RagA family TonB-linked outer membrane protein [Chitinophaga rhizosphaerae]
MRKMLRLLTALSLILFLLPAISPAQQKAITGTVQGDDGTPMPGVSIRIKGTTRYAQTNPSGQFTIQAAPGEMLEFSFIGYVTKDVLIGDNATLRIIMETSSSALGEVVVTAMGIKKERKALGYSVQDIKADELMKNKDPNLINSLNGKIAGLNITNSGGAPGSSASIVIRGGTSLERDNQPLFVVDGMPIDNSTGQGDNSAFDGMINRSTTNSNRAMDLNPEDIESISVLKGPAAAALYGIRAANGAIVITTKKGKDGATSASITSRYTNSWVNKLPKQQSTFKQGSSLNGTFTDQTTVSWGKRFEAGEEVYDNVRNFFQHGQAFDNSFTVTGGNKNGNFFLSGSALRQTGIVPTTGFNRSTVRFNGEQKIGRFTFGINSSFSHANTTKTLTANGLWDAQTNGALEGALVWPRNRDMRYWLDPNGAKVRLLPAISLDANGDLENPNWILHRNPQGDKTNRWLGTAYANVKITDWLDATYRLGIDNYVTQFSTIISPGSSVKEAWLKGMISETDRNYQYINSNFMLNFHKNIGRDWDLNFLLGTTAEDFKTKSNSLRAENLLLPNKWTINNADRRDRYALQKLDRSRLVGAYGDLRVSYKNMVFLSATGRNDWTSTLTQDNWSFFYPAVSGSFVFTELMEKNSILSYGKVRASWAQVGKVAPAYQTATYLKTPELTIGGGFRNEWTRGNPNMKPETTTSTEVGTELRFLGNRLGLDVTYYVNNSRDQILQPRVSNATGYILSYVNTGEIENRGIEVSINANPIRKKDFNWDVALNFSKNKGTVKSLPAALPILYVTDVQVGNAKAASFDGGNFMGLSGSRWQHDENGNTILDWDTGLPKISGNTTENVGNREPNLLGGINNSFTYKNWNLSFLWDFRLGGDVFNGTEYMLVSNGLSTITENRDQNITLTGVSMNPGTNKYEAKTATVKATEKFYREMYLNHIPFFVEKVNWMRLRSLSLTYNLPQGMFSNMKWVKNASLSLNGNNLLLFTNYTGMDPETSAAGAGVIGSGSVGIDYGGIPSTSGLGVSLHVKF